MAKKKTEGLQTGDGAIPRVKMGEIGSTGLAISNKQIVEESRRELQWPRCIKTYKEMQKDTTISSAINLLKIMLRRVKWDVNIPKDATEDFKKKAEYIKSCMDDMDVSWSSFIQDVASSYVYGFSVHEKVYRRRRKEDGSKYNDGLVGWKKLPIRSQDTISGWIFDDEGRELIAVEQDLSIMKFAGRHNEISNVDKKKVIPRNKFLLFRTNPERDNPEGTSMLKSAYLSYRYRTAIEEQEAIGVVRNMVGTPVDSAA